MARQHQRPNELAAAEPQGRALIYETVLGVLVVRGEAFAMWVADQVVVDTQINGLGRELGPTTTSGPPMTFMKRVDGFPNNAMAAT